MRQWVTSGMYLHHDLANGVLPEPRQSATKCCMIVQGSIPAEFHLNVS